MKSFLIFVVGSGMLCVGGGVGGFLRARGGSGNGFRLYLLPAVFDRILKLIRTNTHTKHAHTPQTCRATLFCSLILFSLH